MARDIFLKITGINGESQDAIHRDAIEVIRWGWSIFQQASPSMRTGGRGRHVTVRDLTFEHLIDRASPSLMKYAFSGERIEQAVLIVRKAGAEPLEYMRLTMNDVLITSISPSGHDGIPGGTRETVSLSFTRVKQEYVVQHPKGGSGGVVSASIDLRSFLSPNGFK